MGPRPGPADPGRPRRDRDRSDPTYHGPDRGTRKNADTTAGYLLAKDAMAGLPHCPGQRMADHRGNGDFDPYSTWHLTQEQQRIHDHCYLDGISPRIAGPQESHT